MGILEPSIRGAALRRSIDWLGQLVVDRCTTLYAVGARLTPDDEALLGEPVDGDDWYPIARAGRIEEALILVHGGRPEAVMRELGARYAGDWITDHARTGPQRIDANELIEPGDLIGGESPLSFGRWRMRCHGALDFELELGDVSSLPESTRLALNGFLQAVCAATIGRDVRVGGVRVGSDRAVFRVRAT